MQPVSKWYSEWYDYNMINEHERLPSKNSELRYLVPNIIHSSADDVLSCQLYTPIVETSPLSASSAYLGIVS